MSMHLRWLALLVVLGTCRAADRSADDYLAESRRCYEAGRFQQSVAAARECLRLRPDDPLAQVNLCAAYNELGRWEEAIAAGERAVELDPTNPLARNNLAWSRRHAGSSCPAPTAEELRWKRRARYLRAAMILEHTPDRQLEVMRTIRAELGGPGPVSYTVLLWSPARAAVVADLGQGPPDPLAIVIVVQLRDDPAAAPRAIAEIYVPASPDRAWLTRALDRLQGRSG